MSELSEKLDFIEDCIKTGQFSLASQSLDKIPLSQITRSLALRTSNLARRCGKVKKSLKILNPIVRNPIQKQSATGAEMADYAFSLHRIGATFEADELLQRVNPEEAPSALFFRSILAFSKWEYSEARNWLTAYVQSDKISDYQKMMGRSNLVNILLYEKEFEKAQDEIQSLMKEATNKKLGLLKNICLEQQAESLIGLHRYEEATELLKVAAKTASDSGKRLQTWIWKWQTYTQAKQKNKESGIKFLDKAIKEATSKGAWEIHRDFDLFKVILFDDANAKKKLQYGTPFKNYLNRLPPSIESSRLEEPYSFVLNKTLGTTPPTIDLNNQTITSNDTTEKIKLTATQIKVLNCLLVDFYRPRKWGELFNSVFPDQFFDPFSSINRLHQTLFRINSGLSKQNIGIKVTSDVHGCHLVAKAPYSFLLKRDRANQSNLSPNLILLKNQISRDSEFTIDSLSPILEGDKRTHQRIIKDLISEGKVVRLGKGRSTRYKLVS